MPPKIGIFINTTNNYSFVTLKMCLNKTGNPQNPRRQIAIFVAAKGGNIMTEQVSVKGINWNELVWVGILACFSGMLMIAMITLFVIE
jgi:hypothetical protein